MYEDMKISKYIWNSFVLLNIIRDLRYMKMMCWCVECNENNNKLHDLFYQNNSLFRHIIKNIIIIREINKRNLISIVRIWN